MFSLATIRMAPFVPLSTSCKHGRLSVELPRLAI